MRNHFLNLGFLILALSSAAVDAEILSKDAIPSQVLDQLYKRHPNAIDVSAEKKTHFKRELFEVSFKEEKDKEKIIELYRPTGRFFVNADDVTASNMMPAAAYDNLKAAFDTYTIKEAILVVNPNGIGEEYDLTVTASGNDWSVIIDRTGSIAQKERD
ncbi:MAG: hypothetical protein NTV43_08870 [Methylococcales bacterium]|nr:hypothetical protein [Methylococcales bacterium]